MMTGKASMMNRESAFNSTQ